MSRFPLHTLKRSVQALALAAVTASGMLVTAPMGNAAIDIPAPTGEEAVSETIQVTDTLDGGLKRYYGEGELGGGDQEEGQPAIFELADGATLENVIIGSPAADGVHCLGTCTLRNVWWEDVGEDAATFEGTDASQTMTIEGGGAQGAEDKVFQANGPGTMTISNVQVEDFGTLYRSCGNCDEMMDRHVVIDGVTATAPGDKLAGVNINYGDTATFSNVTIVGDPEMSVCTWYEGVEGDGEPEEVGEGPNAENCLYQESDIIYE